MILEQSIPDMNIIKTIFFLRKTLEFLSVKESFNLIFSDEFFSLSNMDLSRLCCKKGGEYFIIMNKNYEKQPFPHK